MHFVDLEWKTKANRKEDIRVFICAAYDIPTMRNELTSFMKRNKMKMILKPDCAAHCLIQRRKGVITYGLGVHGWHMSTRIANFAHEALHMVEDLFVDYVLPKDADYDVEEQKCLVLGDLVEYYVRKVEGPDENNILKIRAGQR